MKKIFCVLAIFCVMASFVLADVKGTNGAPVMMISEYDISMGSTDTHDVNVCLKIAENNVLVPLVNEPVNVAIKCKDGDNSGDCFDDVDIISPAGFDVTPSSSFTGADGCSKLTITSDSLVVGTYLYHVNGASYNVQIGSVSIPEFTTIGAGIALFGAGAVYLFRKRKH